MEHPRNGDVTVTYEHALFGGRRRNGVFPTYADHVREAADAGAARRPLPPQGTASRRRTYADGELDVFAAERYFKGAMDGDCKEDAAAPVAVVPVEMDAAARPAVAVRSRSAWARSSVASAGSAASANSQTVLLRDERRRPVGSLRGVKCCMHAGVLLRSCSGKRAVRVVRAGGAPTAAAAAGPDEPAASRIEWYRDLRIDKAGLGLAGDGGGHGGAVAGFPPNLNVGAAKVSAIAGTGREESTAAEYTSANLRRSFTLLAPVRVSVPADGVGGGDDDDDDDVGSESSSDLFEIKSLMIDDCPYEPSEASIQWSVVTASAADVPAAPERGGGGGRAPPVAVRQQHRRDRPGGLLAGCVSHRAVDVSSMAAVRRLPGAPPAAPAHPRRANGFQNA